MIREATLSISLSESWRVRSLSCTMAFIRTNAPGGKERFLRGRRKLDGHEAVVPRETKKKKNVQLKRGDSPEDLSAVKPYRFFRKGGKINPHKGEERIVSRHRGRRKEKKETVLVCGGKGM